MRLRLQELQKVVKRTIDEEKAADALKAEVARVLGPSVIIEGKIEQVAEAANERIAVLERTGRASRLDFKPSVVVPFSSHRNAEVRKLAARVLPEKFIGKLATDNNSGVRAIVAARLPLPAVREMMKRFPTDDQLRTTFRNRRLEEAGLPKPETQDEPFDMYGEERLGDATKTPPGPELSEQWYKDQASKFMQDYGRNIEYAWEERAVSRFASSVKATSLVEIDEAKLLKAIKEAIKEKEDLALERDALKETLAWLKGQEKRELLNETAAMPVISEETDPVRELLESNASPSEYIDAANKLFNIRESQLPAAIKKYRLGEENNRRETVPMVGRLPHSRGFRAVDERALDLYTKHWNERQQLRGEPLKLEWNCHPDEAGKIGFQTILR